MSSGNVAPRVVIEDPRPRVECGRLPAKATCDVPLRISAAVFADGHDLIIAWARHGRLGRDPAARTGWREVPLELEENDRFAGWITPGKVGTWAFEIIGMPDEYGSWVRDLRLRLDGGQDVDPELEHGARLAESQAALATTRPVDRDALRGLARALRSPDSPQRRLREAARPAAAALMRRTADRAQATVSGPWTLSVDRRLGGFSAWYELFPRSVGAEPPRSGTLRSAAAELPRVAAMGFDIVYLPPIHPIGSSHRKGRNNTLDPDPDDVGSPWAIGAATGGHTAVHPDLGTVADLRAFVDAARDNGLEVALDYALQCSPDHPWVRQHPRWFRHRPDGSIRYAENPPKKYQDIYPINFDTDDRVRLWNALRDVLLFWIGQGIHVFRVDNPHTKPFPFWEWVIAEVRRRHPEVIFLSEAFTRPAVMHRLAKIGFTQSYTYYTWRNNKTELSEYLLELSQTEAVDWFRPNFWVNTPDILHAYLQHGGPAAFKVRAAIAAITSPSWGMYSGYELLEHEAVREGSEEYLDSEKYQLRPRQWDSPHSIASYIARLNWIRQSHAEAVALLPTLRLHHIGNDNLLCVSRMSRSRDDVLLLIANLDPHNAHEGTTWLDLAALGMATDRPYEAHDEISDTTYIWQGPGNYVRLDPHQEPAHILHLRVR
jgi:starch synthase (maltosyl-transferring)